MAALCVLLAAACCFDYRKKKIPNYLIVAIVFTGVLWRSWEEGVGGAALFLSQAVLVGGLLYPLFKISAVGAGDVKLFGAAAGYLPFQKIFVFLFVSLLIAAIISLVKLWQNNNFKERLHLLMEYLANVLTNGSWRSYPESGIDNPVIGTCLSGPALVSLLLYLGGAY